MPARNRAISRLLLVGQRHRVFAGLRHVGQTQDFHRDGRTSRVNCLAVFVHHRADAARYRAGQHHIALLQRAGLNQQRGDRTAALVEAGLDDDALGQAVDRSLQFQHFGLQQDGLQQRVDVQAHLGRHFDELGIATPIFRHHFMRHQLLADALDVGALLVDLVDRHHHRHLGGLGVVDRFDRLRHHAVVGRHHQHHDVGGLMPRARIAVNASWPGVSRKVIMPRGVSTW